MKREQGEELPRAPETRGIRLATQDEHRGAGHHVDGQHLEPVSYVALVDAHFVQPERRLALEFVHELIDERLETQKKNGSPYLVGDALSAADIYWATFSMSVLPAPTDIMPQTRQNKGMLTYFEANSKIPEIAEALTKRIEDHQRFILKTYCETPAVLGGDPLGQE